ncbi:MAG: hypothetical protein JWO66_881 [Candidatus Eremiobacteraeota bacterium]|nr:hypothetical protein [Candidatus Eremiobacteraeota bacterium]
MAYFLFVDESGQDHREAPYEVLAGMAVEDAKLWQLVTALKRAEVDCFAGTYHADRGELKAREMLKRKTFRLAAQTSSIPHAERPLLARQCLDDPANVRGNALQALAQAKLAYVLRVLEICAEFECRAFGSIVIDPKSPAGPHLRKDYAYLFERFYHFLTDCPEDHRGIVVFDEIGKAKSHLLIGQMGLYFRETANGKKRASRVVPEPFFVHSDLTTGVQLADIVAYVLSWGWEHPLLTKERRAELLPYAEAIRRLMYSVAWSVGRGRRRFMVRSIKVVQTLEGGAQAPYRLRRDVQ